MNIQPIEKRKIRSDGALFIHSIFHTIQGEGPFSGTPCVFVRLAGCNLQCPGCDTDYTSKSQLMTPLEIMARILEVREAPTRLVVITGGEPFRQNLFPLLAELQDSFYYFTQIESNGTLIPPLYDINFEKDINLRKGIYIVCSPKTGRVHPSFNDVACCFKYVMSYDSVDPKDGLPIQVLGHNVKERVARPSSRNRIPIYLQPMDHGNGDNPDDLARNDASLQAVKASCLKHGYIMGVQLHKIIGVD